MNKHVLWLTLSLTTSTVSAFQDDYVSVSSDSSGSANKRILANAPWSLCQLDSPRLNPHECDEISLNLFGEVYKDYALKHIASLPTDNLNRSDVHTVEQHYFMGYARDHVWVMPSLGQFYTLVNRGFISPLNGEIYWAYGPDGHVGRYMWNGHDYTENGDRGKLARLVSRSLPESSGDSLTSIDKPSYLEAVKESSAYPPFWYVDYTDSRSGQKVRAADRTYWSVSLDIQPWMKDIKVFVASASTGGKGPLNIDNRDLRRCKKITVRSHGALLNPWASYAASECTN